MVLLFIPKWAVVNVVLLLAWIPRDAHPLVQPSSIGKTPQKNNACGERCERQQTHNLIVRVQTTCDENHRFLLLNEHCLDILNGIILGPPTDG